MEGPDMSLPPGLLDMLPLLPAWVARQRWYAGKGRVPVLRRIGGLRLEDPAGEAGIEIHLLVDDSGQVPTTYQVPLTSRSAKLSGADHALVATLKPEGEGGGQDSHSGDGARYIYDGPHDPAFSTALLRLMLDEQDLRVARGHRVTAGDPGQVLASHVLSGEQSNSSIVLDLVDALGSPSKPLICKLFRVLHHGQNPDVVVQSALAGAGSTRVPNSIGYVTGQWPDPAAPDGVAAGHLAFAQEFLPGVEDAWRVALSAVAAGEDFSEQARSLGQATAQVHATLAQAMGTRAAGADDIVALTRSMRARHAAALSEVPALAAHDSMVLASIEAVSAASWPALQRIHGDYHLGQVLDAPGRGWVLVDFEGEPLRPLAERTQPDLALRDVAGMLRSFDYVAGSWERENQGQPATSANSAGATSATAARATSATAAGATSATSAREWATRARTAFLEGYAASAGRDPREDAVLLDALELDKALYEVVYEARNRPTWLSIPTTAIARIERLSAGRRSDLRS